MPRPPIPPQPAIPNAALGAQAQAPQAAIAEPGLQSVRGLARQAGLASALNPEQRAIIERVNGYLSGVQVLSGKFVQVGPDGGRTQGEFLYFQARQGALRI